mmetsp:Transcript_192/g.182  ORF Transcript_192/g.182 Transcript_192/m.182 type:complete len:119 (-) Transcript_192:239-595(-)
MQRGPLISRGRQPHRVQNPDPTVLPRSVQQNGEGRHPIPVGTMVIARIRVRKGVGGPGEHRQPLVRSETTGRHAKIRPEEECHVHRSLGQPAAAVQSEHKIAGTVAVTVFGGGTTKFR